VDVVLSLPLFAGFAVAAVVALILLRTTRLFWIPGVAFIGYGVAIYIAWPWFNTHEDIGGLEGLSNVLHVVVSFVVIVAGAVCLFIGARSYQRARRATST
jgi:hypothetical protein